MLTELLTASEKPCKFNMFRFSVLGSSPTTGTIFNEPVIPTDCGFFFAFQRFQAFILHVLCLIIKHEKQIKNGVNANKNANREKANDLDIIRAPPPKTENNYILRMCFPFRHIFR